MSAHRCQKTEAPSYGEEITLRMVWAHTGDFATFGASKWDA